MGSFDGGGERRSAKRWRGVTNRGLAWGDNNHPTPPRALEDCTKSHKASPRKQLREVVLRNHVCRTVCRSVPAMRSNVVKECQCQSTKRGARTGPLVFSVRCSIN